MTKSESMKDRRKYPRVLVEPSSKNLQVEVIGFGTTLVFDMSYTGAAFAQPKEKKIQNVDQVIELKLKTEVDQSVLKSKVIRVNEEVVAVEFDQIDVSSRIIIDRVVTDRIIGINMLLIDPKHYSPQADFSFWFHGPRETNLYLWTSGDDLIKAQMDMDTASLVFEDDSLFFENKPINNIDQPRLNNQQLTLKVLAVVEQMDMTNRPLKTFRKILAEHVNIPL